MADGDLTQVQYDEIPVPQWIKQAVLQILRELNTTPSLMSQLNVNLGIMFGEAVKTFCEKNEFPITYIDLIGSHGQTIWLLSRPKQGETRSAFCLGEGTVMSGLTGITTVTGSEWPSKPSEDREHLSSLSSTGCCFDTKPSGGSPRILAVSPTYVSSLPSEGGVDAMVDWDCGPGNMFIDAAMRYYTDGEMEYHRDGEWGAKGTVNQDIVDNFLTANSYCNTHPPKTTGREDFGDNEALEIIADCEKRGMDK